jgi:hypothetical protein
MYVSVCFFICKLFVTVTDFVQPWHVGTNSLPAVGGVNQSVRRHVAVAGAHHQELRFASEWDARGVHEARETERNAVQTWLKQT